MMKDTEINPHAKEAWKVTKSTAKGHYIKNLVYCVSMESSNVCRLFLNLSNDDWVSLQHVTICHDRQ